MVEISMYGSERGPGAVPRAYSTILSIPVAHVPVAPGLVGERILSIPVAHCVVESVELLELGRHLPGVPGVQLVLVPCLGP